VVKAGRTLSITRGEVYAEDGTQIALMQQTLMMLAGRPDHRE
jgi:acyl-coenzyme A thioesterase PaaI-like protein